MNPKIVIKNRNKGESIVIQNKDDYMKEAHNVLYDAKYYQTLDTDPSGMLQMNTLTWSN